MKALCFLVACGVLPGLPAGAQQIPMRSYTMRDGLSHANVFRILQDERGFMLFSTGYGISVFDSKDFHNYTRRGGLPHNAVLSAAPYGAHRQLLCTYGGGLALKTEGGIARFPLRGGEMPARVLGAAASQHRIWMIGLHTTYRLYCIERGMSRMIDVPNGRGGQASFLKLVPQRDGSLMLCAADGLYRVDAHGRVERLFASLVRGRVLDVERGPDGSYWVAQLDKLVHIGRGRVVRSDPFVGEATLTDLLTDRQGTLWIGTLGDGLYWCPPGATRILHADQLADLPKAIINDLYEDRDGSLWIATHGRGVYRLDGLDVKHYAPQRGEMNAYCRALAPLNDSEVATGSIGTLSIYDGRHLRPMPSRNVHPGDYVYFTARHGAELFVGTAYALFRKSVVPPYREHVIPYQGKAVGCISFFEDRRGAAWFGSFDQLYRLQGDSLILEPVAPPQRIDALAEGADGTLWAGTDSGLLCSSNGRFIRHRLCGFPPDTRINAIHQDRRGVLWLASSEGLLVKDGPTITRFAAEEGLTSNPCNALAGDGDSLLWVGSINGLSCINLRTRRVRDYRSQLYPNEVLFLLPFHGQLLAGLVDGLSVMQTPLLGREAPPPLYITALRTGTRSLPAGGAVRLPHWDNKLVVDFIAVSYRNAGLIGYRYQIRGLDTGWHYTTGNSIALSALPYGDYTLLLAARQNSGRWSPDVRLRIHVARPLWRQGWVVVSAAALVLVLTFQAARWQALRRETKKRRQLAVYNKIAYLKQQALSALINPHFVFNCMNSIQHYLNRHDNDAANEYLADFAGLIRMTMESAQQVFISLADEVTRLRLYLSLEHLRFGDDLRYELVLDPSLDAAVVRIPNMILQPYVENAILHGIMPKRAPGFLSIRFSRCADGLLEIVIEDDGVGFRTGSDAGRLRSPLGMRLTEERLELLHRLLHQPYEVQVQSRQPQPGTVVRFRVPLRPDETLLRNKEAMLHDD